ncbi:MAG: type II secretion system protein [Bacilli bacterium]|nr:type II secretion system protein [Bacilli bacterium]
MKNKGFTMIELLAAIVILGILSVIAIASVSHVRNNADKEDKEMYENTLKMAAESYMQANKSALPKNVGGKVTLTAEFLAEKKYLKEDRGGYVVVSKETNTHYKYEVNGDGEPPEETECTPKPSEPQIYFTDSSLQEISSDILLNNFREATLFIKISGGEDENGEDLKILSYNYSIYVKTEGEPDLHEAYNSGALNGNGEEYITVTRPISEYIDVTTATYISARVEVTNEKGCMIEKSPSQGTLKDPDNPKCTNKKVGESDTWINKDSPEKSRTITVTCDDGNGSGCIRPTFARTWPNTHQPDAEYGYIQVQDNAGNFNLQGSLLDEYSICDLDPTPDSCRVKVNVDKTLPTINVLGAYKSTADGKQENTTNTYSKGTLVINDDTSSRTGTIETSEYDNLIGGWMNNARYPNGVIYKIEISDNIHLDSWKWETNVPYVTNPNTDVYGTLGTGTAYDRYASTVSTEEWKGNCGTKKKVILVGFNKEGRRQGLLTVKDKAGNTVTLRIKANIDKTPPKTPKVEYSNYTPTAGGNWSKVQFASATVISDNNKKDRGADLWDQTLDEDLSGWNRFEHTIDAKYDSSKSVTNKNGGSILFNTDLEGKNEISFRTVDNAGNISTPSDVTKVWVDYTLPKCNVVKTAPGENSAGWIGLDSSGNQETVTVTATCEETASNKNSGCTGRTTFSTIYGSPSNGTYNKELYVSNAGADGLGAGGSVKDLAGNVRTCAANKTVHSDYKKPTCYIGGQSSSWRRKGTTITRECRDSASSVKNSGCKKTVYFSESFAQSGHTYKTKDYGALNIYDNADNVRTCAAFTAQIYVDLQKPSCSKDKSHQNTTDGVTVKYSCGDHGGSGVVSCPGGSDHKDTGLKKDKSYTVKDNVGNSMTCTVNITAYKQYKYIKKNVAATCTNTCCGKKKKKWKEGTSCTWCGMSSSTSRKCTTKASYTACKKSGCTICGKYADSCWCCCSVTVNKCKKCRDEHFGARSVKCTDVGCCGYACGSQWTGWGAASTGCSSTYRWLYK